MYLDLNFKIPDPDQNSKRNYCYNVYSLWNFKLQKDVFSGGKGVTLLEDPPVDEEPFEDPVDDDPAAEPAARVSAPAAVRQGQIQPVQNLGVAEPKARSTRRCTSCISLVQDYKASCNLKKV
jgi:hypothetical protein